MRAPEPVNERLDEKDFFDQREEVLARWQTGREVADLERGIDYQLGMPDKRRASIMLQRASTESEPLIQPRHGDTLVHDQLRVMQAEVDAGADIVSIEADAYTRQGRYDLAEEALASSDTAGRSMVCGYPILAHGVQPTRQIVEAIEGPVSQRMASADSRLCKEVFLASGITYVLLGALQNLAYEKDTPVATLVSNYQYEHRLYGYYTERGAPITLETSATLTGTLVPPCIAITTSTIDALLAARQGVKHIVTSYGTCGNLAQDVAALECLREIGRDRLEAAGHDDVELYTVASQWMSDFPQDESAAHTVIAYGSMAAGLAGADMVMVKSTQEAFGVPTAEAQVAGVKATKAALRLIGDQRLRSEEVASEKNLIRREVDAILDRSLELGDGDWARAAVRGVEAGVIDVPFSPSRHNAGKLIPARDTNGAIRILEHGSVPLPSAVRAVHRERIGDRLAAFSGSKSDMLAHDIFSMSKRLESAADA